MRNRALLGAADRSIWPPSASDPPIIRQTLCSPQQDRCCRCRGDLRGGRPAENAFRTGESTHQQAALLHHRARDLLVRQRTMLINAIRGHLGEFGIIAPAGRHRVADLVNLLQSADDTDVPALAREALQSLFAELSALEMRIKAIEAVIMREHRSNAVSRRLATIPGIGPITASAITGTIADPLTFKSGRELAAWIGLVPRQHSSGGKHKMGRVSKQGDRYLRRLLTVGATAVIRQLCGSALRLRMRDFPTARS